MPGIHQCGRNRLKSAVLLDDSITVTKAKSKLIYAHDPMCSWCWGFRPVWQNVQQALEDKIKIQYLLGGLAPDSQDPMPENMQLSIRDNWHRIQQEIPGTSFNYDFWSRCKPRRSTYPACRAIIACRMQQPQLEQMMLLTIQQAYYLDAKNPSDLATLLNIAGKIGLDEKRFADDIASKACQKTLEHEIKLCRDMGINSFPSLILKQAKSYTLLDIDYNDYKQILSQIV